MGLFEHRKKSKGYKEEPEEKSKDNPSKYEGAEHVKYKNPGFTKKEIQIPEDEPHMKSHVSKTEGHEVEDTTHMKTPDQTEDTLPARLKRAMMKMDDKDHDEPKPILGNLVRTVGKEGVEDEAEEGEEEEGDNDMQKNSMPKEHRKKMIVAVLSRKLKKR